MRKHLSTATGMTPAAPEALQTSAHLDAWIGRSWADGVQVDGLRDLDLLLVRTLNSVYVITLVTATAGEAIVRGGRFFPQPARAVILGSSMRGAFLKLRGIYCGFALELYSAGTRIVTSAVQSVHCVEDDQPGRVQ